MHPRWKIITFFAVNDCDGSKDQKYNKDSTGDEPNLKKELGKNKCLKGIHRTWSIKLKV